MASKPASAPGATSLGSPGEPSRAPVVTSAASALAVALGLTVLTGWIFDVSWLRGPTPGLAEMKPNTAIAFVLAGASLGLLAPRSASRRRGAAGRACAVAVALIGGLSLAEYMLDRDLGIDELLFTDHPAASVDPGGLGRQAALEFLLSGLALVALDARSRTARGLVQISAVGVTLISLFAVVGDAYGATEASAVAGFTPMALHTALALLVLSLGLLGARPDFVLVTVLQGKRAGSVMARRLLPAGIVVVPLLGWLPLRAEPAGLADATDQALLVISLVTIVAAGIVATARALNRFERERRQAGIEWERLAAIVEHSDQAIISKTSEAIITSWNLGAERIYGYGAGEAIGRSLSMIVPQDRAGEEREILDRVLTGERLEAFDTQRVTKNGRLIDVSLTVSPIRDVEGAIVGASAIGGDVTERRRTEQALAESERRFREFAERVDEVFWIASPDYEEILYVGPGYEELWGHSADALRENSMAWLEAIHPDDRAAVEESLRGPHPEDKYELEYRVVRPDDSARWVRDKGYLLRDAEGKPYRALGVCDDVTERKLAAEELAEAHAHAERANEAKSEFLSRMSHELRTPLNAVLGFAELLWMDDLGGDQRAYVRHIRESGTDLLNLINEVLDLSRIEAGRMSISPESIQLRPAIREAVQVIAPEAANRGISVHLDEGEDCDHFVCADQQRLKQVLLNLLSNAVKYNREGGSVRICCTCGEDDAPRVAIVDTGPGIPEDQLDRLFDPFDRLEADQREPEGTGLGLALSKRLVDLMEGRLWVESEVGRGTTLWLELPAADQPDVDRTEAAAEEDAATEADASQLTLLYIEDHVSNFELVEAALARLGSPRLLSAMQGGVGIDLAARHRPDVVLLDLHLPDMSGADVLAQLKSDSRTRSIPVIVLSADATERQMTRVLAGGAYEYLTKPLNVPHFLETLQRAAAERKSPVP